MPEKKMERRSLQLTGEEWQKLEEMAEKLNILAPTSANVGNPSWRSMIKAVAKGDLVIFDAEIMKEMEKTLQTSLEQTSEYTHLQQLKDKIKALNVAINYQEDEIKEHEEKEFSLTGKKNTHPIEGVQIKKFSVVRILNEKKAIKWAGDNAPSVLSLKKAPFNKVAKALDGLKFVEIYSEYRAQIASDLSMYEGEQNE